MKSISKSILALAVVFAAGAANACSISYYTLNDQVTRALTANNGFAFKNYNSVCEKLQKANARLLISSQNGVASQRAVAYAHVVVMDKKIPVVAFTVFGGSVQLNTDANTNKSESILADAVNEAIENLDIDAALKELAESRKLAKYFPLMSSHGRLSAPIFLHALEPSRPCSFSTACYVAASSHSW